MSLLPLGSVIKIKNYKFCVIGYSSVDREQLVETGYLAVSYPLGFTSINKTVFIPKDANFDILSEGYKTEKSASVLDVIWKSIQIVDSVPNDKLLKFVSLLRYNDSSKEEKIQ